jgi:hypothetical protein
VRLFFPLASTNDFGSMIQVGQAISIVTYLILITNTFKNKSQENIPKELWMSLFTILTCGASIKLILNYRSDLKIAIVVLTLIAIYFSIPLLKLMRSSLIVSIQSLFQFLTQPGDLLLNDFVHWTHTWNGRIIPTLFFTCVVALYSGTSFFALLLCGFFIFLATCLIFFTIVSKNGFLNSLLEGNLLSIGIFGVILVYLIKLIL